MGALLPTSCGANRMDMTMTSVSPVSPPAIVCMGTLGRSSRLLWKNDRPIEKIGVTML
jgi:hypothetical protein